MPKAYLHDYVYKLLATYEEEDLRKPRNPAKQFPGGVGSRENRRIDPCIEHIDPILVKSGEEWAFIPVSRHLLAFCPPRSSRLHETIFPLRLRALETYMTFQ
jgi:hypothetical protein